jgi:hypothetical protein
MEVLPTEILLAGHYQFFLLVQKQQEDQGNRMGVCSVPDLGEIQ